MKIKKFSFALVSILVAVSLSGCFVRGGRIRGDGNVVNQERQAAGFNGIAVTGAGNINIRHAEDCKVVVRTDSNLQDIIETKVSGDSLYIGVKPNSLVLGGFTPTELTVDVFLPELKSIVVSGAANIKIEGGKTANLSMSVAGACKIDAENFEAQNVDVSLSGASDVKLWATAALSYNISGVGNIRYRGSPALNGKIGGVGNIRPL